MSLASCLAGALLFASHAAPVHAAELTALAEGPPLRPGRLVPVLVVVSEGGEPLPDVAPEVALEGGQLAGLPLQVAPGVWRLQVRLDEALEGGLDLVLRTPTGEARERLPLDPAPSPRLAFDPPDPVIIGRSEEVLLTLRGADLPPLDHLELSVPEGRVLEARQAGDAVEVVWEPGSAPFPRVVPVGARDDRGPQRPPAWTLVELRARPRIPVRTGEPGSSVAVRIGGRRYGPVATDERGEARLTVEVRPGEERAEVLTTDALGNERRSSLPLGGGTGGALAGLLAGAHNHLSQPPRLHLYGVDEVGRPWRGAPPACESSLGRELKPVVTGPGLGELALTGLPDDAFFDVRVDCSLGGDARTSLRVPVAAAAPARIEVQAVPEELSADSPRSRVQAWVESRSGTRLAADDIRLQARHGSLRREDARGRAAARAQYDGTEALVHGGDVVQASWRPAPGSGPTWDLDVAGRLEGDEVLLAGRALDAEGRPLPGVLLELGLGEQLVSGQTDDTGWARARLPAPEAQAPWVLTASHAGLVSRGPLLPGARWGTDPDAADLVDTVELRLVSGRVREVFLTTEPRSLSTGSGATARVELRLLDSSGIPITDAGVALAASSGVVTRPQVRGDGTWEATYAPPPGQRSERVRIIAESTDGSFASTATDLELVPRRARASLGIGGGYLVGNGGLGSPYLQLDGQARLPWLGDALYGHLGVGLYGLTASQIDSVTGERIQLELSLLPLELGMLARRERRSLAGSLGAAFVLAPYRLVGRFGEAAPTRGLGLGPPGFRAFVGAGWRVRNNELQLQLGYLVLPSSAPDVGFQGSTGGLLGTLGYKVHF